MEHPGFFERAGPFTLARVAEVAGAVLPPQADPNLAVHDVRPLSEADTSHVSFLDNRKYLGQLLTTQAAAVFIVPALQDRLPPGVVALTTKQPYHAFAKALALFYPEAGAPQIARAAPSSPLACVDPSARLEEGVLLEPHVVVGPGAVIGRGTRVAAGAVIGANVHIGRNCYIGALSTIAHALLGDRVVVHTGVRIGQDGFGFAMGREGHLKVPQIGRVVIQDDVEIGANTSIDRGALKDTIIGEGTKIDNLVQIGHNVVIGRHCVIVAQTGIAGSTELGDFVVMGGQSGTVGHIKVGSGAQIAGAAHPKDDVPPGARMGGTPAKPLKDWARELAILKRLIEQDKGARGGDEDPENV